MDLTEGCGAGEPVSQFDCVDPSSSRKLEARVSGAVSSNPTGTSVLSLSCSEEEEVISIDPVEEASPPSSPAYEELIEVVTRTVSRLDIDWPVETRNARPRKSKLDERYLPARVAPQRRAMPFFQDLHTEVSRSWKKPASDRVHTSSSAMYATLTGAHPYGYGGMPKVDEALAGYLVPQSASTIKAPALPTKPLRVTSSLVGKAYSASSQAAACLHTTALLQAYQADLLGDLDQGGGIGPEAVAELRRAMDLSLRATRETAFSVGRSMAALVATERHLWLNLSAIKDKDKFVLLDAPLSPSGLFGDAVKSVVDKFQEAARQQVAFSKVLPRHPSREPNSQTRAHSSSYRASQKESVASRLPPPNKGRSGQHSRAQPSGKRMDLRNILNAKKAASKRS